ncbi:MAG: hypothetical protein EXS63_00195 [Candidatus Omnitrophica bacterium]|nr:hypothetical protein [Candidatus Omnitrophota bacterium]
MNKLHRIALVLLTVMVFQSSAFAGTDPMGKITSDNYVERASWRLLHGVVNLASSPAHIIAAPIHASKDSCCVVKGLGQGLVDTVKFAILGAWDIVTFWVPGQAGKDISVKECGVMQLSGKSQCHAPAKS